ncbi:hypothetical protein WJX72_008045 [[Myrmecia] bisecta]|uniref:3-dehydroquinate synthase n=1 Tax=[Myrmecia] bisecta TaxID=41462 RepID=A0AAW1Q8B9_9CHLO
MPARASVTGEAKEVWIETSTQAVLTTALELGLSKFAFSNADPKTLVHIQQWTSLAKFEPILYEGSRLETQDGTQVGVLRKVSSGEDLKAVEKDAQRSDTVILDATDWRVIPAENLVASFQGSSARLMSTAKSAADARLMLEALEVGTGGVLLRTEDPGQVRKLVAYVSERNAKLGLRLPYEVGRVTRVTPVGMGDRVCVDLCSLLVPGEGMLVGSFARTLFLVHSECAESRYISSRPFRVNAGPVHAYTAAPGGRTAYLAELSSGKEVVVADARGRTQTAIVGRVKIESRPLMLIEAETSDGEQHSILLQNAETVYLYRQNAARHTGISIQEKIVER